MRPSLRLLVCFAAIAASFCCGDNSAPTEVQRLKTANLDIVLLSTNGAIRHGRETFVIEFQAPDGKLVDVGTVKANASMAMAGSPMFGSVDVAPTATRGRYTATSDISMAGTWRFTVEWDGPAGKGSAPISASVQ